MASFNPTNPEGLAELNEHFLVKSYITGFQGSDDDLSVYNALNGREPDVDTYPHLNRWFNHVKALIASRFPGEAAGVTIVRGKGGQGGGDAKKKEKKEKKKADKAPEKPQEPAEDAAAKAAKLAEKLHAKCVKEGGKKGVEIAGAADMGGLEYFCTTIEAPDGDIDLLKVAIDAMNKEIDPTDEESKGGSGEVGKMIFSAGKDKLAVLAYAPESNGKIDCAKWLSAVMNDVNKPKWEVVGEPAAKWATAYALGNSQLGLFPIKIKDDTMTAAFKHLRENDAFPEDDGDDEDDYCYGDDAFDNGFE